MTAFLDRKLKKLEIEEKEAARHNRRAPAELPAASSKVREPDDA